MESLYSAHISKKPSRLPLDFAMIVLIVPSAIFTFVISGFYAVITCEYEALRVTSIELLRFIVLMLKIYVKAIHQI